jgi:ABC-type transport system involved in multi-copper enzyme maturation permease subunit
MNIIADNPVLKREMRRRLRIRFAGRPWMFGVLIIAAIVIWYYAQGVASPQAEQSDEAQGWWEVIIYGMLVAICLSAPTGSARIISQERERQTWDALALTRLSAAQVLLGKWLAQIAAIVWFPVALLPLAVAAAIAGNVATSTIVAVYAYIFLNSVCFTGIGLFCSFCFTRSPAAMASAFWCRPRSAWELF